MNPELRRVLSAPLAAFIALLLPALVLADEAGFEDYRAGRYDEAFLALMPLANDGNSEAQYVLGLMYANGQGVAQNFYEAGKMYRRAGEAGHADAQVNLGSLYENCLGNGPCNSASAADWYAKAADQGDGLGQYNLAVMYATGTGVAQDEWRARVLFRKSAEQGHSPAQYNLAVIYERGMGGPVDRVAACAWYDVAAVSGYADGAKACDRLAESLSGEELIRAKSLSEQLLEAYGND